MPNIEFAVYEDVEYTTVSFEISIPLLPSDLVNISPPTVDGTKGVLLSGRGPIWLYCFLTHFYHPTKFIATYDPRIGGAVVVESHSVQHAIGDVLEPI